MISEQNVDLFDLFDHEILFATSYLYFNKIGNKMLFTIGCELSEWDGERIVEQIGKDKEAIIINTCAVTQGAKDASDKIAEKMHDIYPNIPIFIVGCAIDYKNNCQHIGKCLKNKAKFDTNQYGNLATESNTNFIHNKCTPCGIVKIQDGCKNHCSYCVVPKLRSEIFSLPYSDIKRQISELLESGKIEIQLVATEVGDYNSDGMKLYQLICKILADFPYLQKLSFNAIDPASPELDKIIELAKHEKRIGNLIELAVQSASDKVLKDMKRRYDTKRLFEIKKLAGDIVHFRWHLILGFPTETDVLFNETLENIKKLQPANLSIFKFSPREMTDAYDMQPQCTSQEVDQRIDIVHSLMTNIDYKSKTQFKNIQKYYPEELYKRELTNSIDYSSDFNFCQVNLYDNNVFYNIARKLDTAKQYNNTFFLIRYDQTGNQRDLELNCKLLTMMFGIRNIIEIELDDEMVQKILDSNINLYNLALYYSAFIKFKPLTLSQNSLVIIDQLISKLYSSIYYPVQRLYYDAVNAGNTILAEILEERLSYANQTDI